MGHIRKQGTCEEKRAGDGQALRVRPVEEGVEVRQQAVPPRDGRAAHRLALGAERPRLMVDGPGLGVAARKREQGTDAHPPAVQPRVGVARKAADVGAGEGLPAQALHGVARRMRTDNTVAKHWIQDAIFGDHIDHKKTAQP